MCFYVEEYDELVRINAVDETLNSVLCCFPLGFSIVHTYSFTYVTISFSSICNENDWEYILELHLMVLLLYMYLHTLFVHGKNSAYSHICMMKKRTSQHSEILFFVKYNRFNWKYGHNYPFKLLKWFNSGIG